jgi:hypothetical protein
MRYHRLEADKIEKIDGLSRLKRMLATHDWYFDYSDDHSVWQRGVDERKAIKALAKELGMEEVFEEAFDAVTNNNLKSFLKTL